MIMWSGPPFNRFALRTASAIGWRLEKAEDTMLNCYKAQYGLGIIGYFFWDETCLHDLVHAGSSAWLHRVGCYFWDEAGPSKVETGSLWLDRHLKSVSLNKVHAHEKI